MATHHPAHSAHTVFPAPLQAGSRIFITAPSSGVAAPHHARLDHVLDTLRGRGWVVEEGHCLRQEHRSASASADARAAEWMAALLRDDIAAVLPPWGGELAIELLPRMDWAALACARPKWIMGFSDLSTLCVPITLRLGWATAHGLNLMDLCAAQQDPLSAEAQRPLMLPGGASFTQQASTHWQRQWLDFVTHPLAGFQLTEPTAWRGLNRRADEAVQCRGRLIGGCLDTLMHLVGTPFAPMGAWRQRLAESAASAGSADAGDTDTGGDGDGDGDGGVILYLENCELAPPALVRALAQLRLAGWFDGLAGLLLGRSTAPEPTAADALRYEDALRQTLGDLPCPVLFDLDIGHRPPQMTLINGARAALRWGAGDRGQVTQWLA